MSSKDIAVNIAADEEVVVRTRKKRLSPLRWQAFGVGHKDNKEAISIWKVVGEFSKFESFLFSELGDKLDWSNKVILDLNDYNKSEARAIGNASRTWIKKNLLKKMKPNHYMVNPWFITPKAFDKHLEIISEWEQL